MAIACLLRGYVTDSSDPYETHFGPNSSVLTETVRTAVDQGAWTTSKEVLGRLGPATVAVPGQPDPNAPASRASGQIDVRFTVSTPCFLYLIRPRSWSVSRHHSRLTKRNALPVSPVV